MQLISLPVRILVSPLLLSRIFHALWDISLDTYQVIMFCPVFTTAFFAFLRVSEYTVSRHVLLKDDIILTPQAVRIVFSSYNFSKHCISSILLPAIHSTLCPVAALGNYRLIRPNKSGPIFLCQDASPINAADARSILR